MLNIFRCIQIALLTVLAAGCGGGGDSSSGAGMDVAEAQRRVDQALENIGPIAEPVDINVDVPDLDVDQPNPVSN